LVTPDEVTGWIELPESGWGALVGWVAGASRLRRIPDEPGQHVTVITEVSPDGVRFSTEPRSTAEQSWVDADITGYLADAHVPARPAGYRWFLLPPRSTDEDEFWAAVNDGLAQIAPRATHPAEIVQPLRRVLAELYRR
jgi:hypothetical protein